LAPSFLQSELSWSISKADDELTPIVQRIARRGQLGSLTKQSRLDPFFDMSLGANAYIPRVRTKHPSKRLQSVIKAFRAAEARARGEEPPRGFGEMLADLNEQEKELVKVDEVDGEEVAPTRRRSSVKKRKSGEVQQDGEQQQPKRRAPTKRKSTANSTSSDVTPDSAEPSTTSKKRKTPSRTASSDRGRGRGRRGGRSIGTPLSRASSTTEADPIARGNEAINGDDNVPSRPRPRKKQVMI
jgi:DNA excision repair protein ERCC-5